MAHKYMILALLCQVHCRSWHFHVWELAYTWKIMALSWWIMVINNIGFPMIFIGTSTCSGTRSWQGLPQAQCQVTEKLNPMMPGWIRPNWCLTLGLHVTPPRLSATGCGSANKNHGKANIIDYHNPPWKGHNYPCVCQFPYMEVPWVAMTRQGNAKRYYGCAKS